MSDCGCGFVAKNNDERRVLIILLCINASMFVAEMVFGIISESIALIADSLDMLADATVYGVALYAVSRPAIAKIKAAFLSGIFQILLGLSVAIDIVRRLIWGSDPESFLMIIVGIIALIANAICLILISKYRKGEVHMRASWIFSRNDVLANIGIVIGGFLVYYLDSRLPDLIIGIIITLIVVWGGIFILKDAAKEKQVYLNAQ